MRSHFPASFIAMTNIAGLMAFPAAAAAASSHGNLSVGLTIQPACSANLSSQGLPVTCSPGVTPQATLMAPELQAGLSEQEIAVLNDFQPEVLTTAMQPPKLPRWRLLLSF